jgi:multisubunit Na+/H+ antiporter MnhB subunit
MRFTLRSEALSRSTRAAATIAGIWAGLGIAAFLAWAAQPGSALHQSWAGTFAGPVAGLVFVLIPIYLFVVRRDAEAIPWLALRHQTARQRLLRVLSRALIWAASAAATAALSRYAFHALGVLQFPLN